MRLYPNTIYRDMDDRKVYIGTRRNDSSYSDSHHTSPDFIRESVLPLQVDHDNLRRYHMRTGVPVNFDERSYMWRNEKLIRLYYGD